MPRPLLIALCVIWLPIAVFLGAIFWFAEESQPAPEPVAAPAVDVPIRPNPGALAELEKKPKFTTRADPSREQVEFAFDQERIAFGEVRPHTGATVSVVAYSQRWNSFQIEQVESTNPELQWEIAAADADTIARHNASAAYRIEFRLPAGMEAGRVAGDVSLKIVPGSSDTALTRSLPITGRVLRRLALYGETITYQGVLDMGVTQAGKTAKYRLLMKVRDEQLDLPVRKITSDPEFVQVSITPKGKSEEDAGLYYLDIVLPDSAPVCDHTNLTMGTIRLEFDHPRIPSLELRSHFTIVEKSPLY